MNREPITTREGNLMPAPFLNGSVKNGNHFNGNALPEKSPQTLPEILFITSYPPRECGIATYSQDLLTALNNQFKDSFKLTVCALESGTAQFSDAHYAYPDEVKYILSTDDVLGYVELSHTINKDTNISLVLVQHEFGFFQHSGENAFVQFLFRLNKPAVVVFHTVLPQPTEGVRMNVRHIAAASASVVVMTQNSAHILSDVYGIPQEKIVVIPHGTHLVQHLNKTVLKEKYGLAGRKVLSTFGLLSSGKGIETTLDSLPAIIARYPEAIFLVLGKTHPGVIQSEGERYRNMLERKVVELNLEQHVRFINRYLPLPDLLEYLQLTDMYLFTSKDPNQAVSGTFSYAMSCGCPIISTPIPHAREVLRDDTGIIIDFGDSLQLANAVNRLMGDEPLRTAFSSNTLQRIVPTAWENSAVAHALLFQTIAGRTYSRNTDARTGYARETIPLHYRLPGINLHHVQKMTTDVGMFQFANGNQPDSTSGYTLDDNARALIALCMHYELTGDDRDVALITTYLNFIGFCQQPEGNFLNYVDTDQHFTDQNAATNLADSNGRAVWALGYVISQRRRLPSELIRNAEQILQRALRHIATIYSTRAMAFAIKGLHYSNRSQHSPAVSMLITTLANRLVQLYRHESESNWQWYESYMTYANSIMPEALLCAWLETNNAVYKTIATASFDFLLSLTFHENGIKVISNQSWLQKGHEAALLDYGEQPIDVAYTVMALSRFYDVFKEESYAEKMTTAFNWFLGNNHLHQIIYNPCTGGCYDGLEEQSVNLNQGAESTVSYLMARLTMEKYRKTFLAEDSNALPKKIADSRKTGYYRNRHTKTA
jgi:glycosyltransferase involved in cell wall biosynthesis